MLRSSVEFRGREPSRDMRESQRALELRKFFAPGAPNYAVDSSFNDTLNNDGALDAYAETVVWRLNGAHAMVSLVDRGTQYFLAGAIRAGHSQEDPVDDVITTGMWYGCSTVPTPGGLCENTLAVDLETDEYPCFIVDDLTKDERFAGLAVVDGSLASYRFYAGVPITTNHGINIGSFFLFDNHVRCGLTLKERKFMHQQAKNVMKHLETKREAAERRRTALMSDGLARFLEWTSRENEINEDQLLLSEEFLDNDDFSQQDSSTPSEAPFPESQPEPKTQQNRNQTSILDRIRVTLDRAADILRESLELKVGGVVFLDTTIGYIDFENADSHSVVSADVEIPQEVKDDASHAGDSIERTSRLPVLNNIANQSRGISKGSSRSATNRYKAPKILATSVAEGVVWDHRAAGMDTKTLQNLTKSYPKGNVWYIDEEGYFSSLEQVHALKEIAGISPSGRRRSNASSIDLSRQKTEATLLSRVFHRARQIMFLPLWDAGTDRWYAGCFVWSRSAVPVFTVDSEISYLAAFTNSVMVEISRLDAITSNKIKSDFISSISHEFRSPLHGILASAEFLRDSELDASQLEFISTIQNCSGTLLDTINHVLDYSKINSFEKVGNKQGTISNELYQVTNLALLCEDIVNGMIAANEFHGAGTGDKPFQLAAELTSQQETNKRNSPLEIIIDIEHKDWAYRIQPGALRRVVMNIFGNAQKYTESGYIMVHLGIQENVQEAGESHSSDIMSLKIRDSGRGMSTEYMERKLYQPFAQEDSFVPGVGLGLSIVWSIVNQLGGKVSIQSELGKGTDVEITIPVERSHSALPIPDGPDELVRVNADGEECIKMLRQQAVGKSVCFLRHNTDGARYTNIPWQCAEKYCAEWFGFEIKTSVADILITDEDDEQNFADAERILIIRDDMVSPKKYAKATGRYAMSRISQPVGPFKLARSLLLLLNEELPEQTQREKDLRVTHASTQTPLGSPEERTIMNGIIMTDYSFPDQNIQQAKISTGSDNLDSVGQKVEKERLASQKNDEDNISSIIGSLDALALLEPPSRNSTPLNTSTTASTQTQLSSQPAELEAETPSVPDTKLGLNILAVDDNALNLQLLHRYLLKRKSDTVVTACNGIEAVTAVRDRPDMSFDVIFMDISMPEMDGFEATRLIRNIERGRTADSEMGRGAMLKPAYIVAVTGLASRRDRNEAEESGFDDFLTKPISFKKIGELLKQLSGT